MELQKFHSQQLKSSKVKSRLVYWPKACKHLLFHPNYQQFLGNPTDTNGKWCYTDFQRKTKIFERIPLRNINIHSSLCNTKALNLIHSENSIIAIILRPMRPHSDTIVEKNSGEKAQTKIKNNIFEIKINFSLIFSIFIIKQTSTFFHFSGSW